MWCGVVVWHGTVCYGMEYLPSQRTPVETRDYMEGELSNVMSGFIYFFIFQTQSPLCATRMFETFEKER